MRITSDIRKNDRLQITANVVITDAELGRPLEIAIVDEFGVQVGTINSITEELLKALKFEPRPK